MKILKNPFIFFMLLLLFAWGISAYTLYNQSIRLDEAQSLWNTTKSFPMVLKLTAQDVHVPLYNILLHVWVQIFGTDIATARLLSFLLFIASLPALYLAAKESSNRNVAMLTLLLYTLSPFIIWYSHEARMYTLFTFAISINHLFFLRFLRSRGRTSKFGLFISTVLGLYTHYFFLVFLLTQGLYVLFASRRFERTFRFIIRYALVMAAAILCLAPWIAYVVLSGSASNTQPLLATPTSYSIFQVFVNFIFGFQSLQLQTMLVSLWPLITLGFFFIFTKREALTLKNTWYFVLTAFFPIFIVFFVSFVRPIFLSRYLIFVTPSLFVLIAWILLGYPKKIASAAIVCILALMVFFSIRQNTSAATPVREAYADVAQYLKQEVSPSDIIAVSAPFTVYPIEYEYTGIARITTVPQWDRFQQGAIPPFTLANFQKQLKDYEKKYTNIYLVLSYDQGYEDDIRNYMERHYQRLGQRTFSQDLEIRKYKLRYDERVK